MVVHKAVHILKGEKMKNSWLRWLRSGEGDVRQFLADVYRYGPAVRVSLSNLNGMSWGDDIYCVIKDAGFSRGGAVFMKFPLRIVCGLSEEGRDALAESCGVDQIMPEGVVVERRFGGYTEGPTYSINANMQEIFSALRSAVSDGADVGRVMAGCYKNTASPFAPPWPVLADVGYTQGVRQFDAPRFMSDFQELELAQKSLIGADLPRLPGYFVAEAKPTGTGEGHIQVALNFHKRQKPIQETFDFAVGA